MPSAIYSEYIDYLTTFLFLFVFIKRPKDMLLFKELSILLVLGTDRYGVPRHYYNLSSSGTSFLPPYWKALMRSFCKSTNLTMWNFAEASCLYHPNHIYCKPLMPFPTLLIPCISNSRIRTFKSLTEIFSIHS